MVEKLQNELGKSVKGKDEGASVLMLAGEDAFKLYDTYGFPLDVTKEILEEKGIRVDIDGFNAAMEIQRTTARAARGESNFTGADATVYDLIDPAETSEFVGYDSFNYQSKVTVMTSESEVVDTLTNGDRGTIFVAKTPFYATSGGQEADVGTIEGPEGRFIVEDTVNLSGGKIGHVGVVDTGIINLGDKVNLSVHPKKRLMTARNHTATHLLHKALKDILGAHVEQAGSHVNDKRLRFDFTHFSSLTPEELKNVENAVNEQITATLKVEAVEMSLEEARGKGAAALFGEKYGDEVRVVTMGDYAIELCGGTHVNNTVEVMAFKILSETGIAAGVRRIEGVTSVGLLEYYGKQEEQLVEISRLIKTKIENLPERIASIQAENKSLHQQLEALKKKEASKSLGDVMDQVVEIKGVKLLAQKLDNVDMNGLRELGDQLKDKLGDGVVVLASAYEGKVNLMVTATDGAIKSGAHAGNLIKAIAGKVGGGGGGRPNMAQAGGKNPAGIDEALTEAKTVLETQV
jgi:alanyl-tRNA synthetase